METARPGATVPPDAEFPWADDFGPVAAKPATIMPTPKKAAQSPVASDPRGWIVLDTGLAICFASLLVGGGAFAIIAVAALAMLSSPDALPNLLSGGGGGFLVVLLIWSAAVWLGSYVSLATGWRVCWAVPKITKTRQMVQAALGCVGVSLGLVLLMQLLALAMVESAPSPRSVAQPRNMAEMKKFQADMDRAAKANVSNCANDGHGYQDLRLPFGPFFSRELCRLRALPGAAGGIPGAAQLKQMAIYFCVSEGVFALWITLSAFVIEPNSLTLVRLSLFLPIVFMLATYGGLIYLARGTGRLVSKQT